MNPLQIQFVQDSFKAVIPIQDQAADLFYGRLFELDPSLRQMFKGDIAEQGRKLMKTLATVVIDLDNTSSILPVVRDLGARHLDFGVTDDQYDTFGAALIWTLEQGLGEAFTMDVMNAWIEAYTLISNTMIEGANKSRKAAIPAPAPVSTPVAAAAPETEVSTADDGLKEKLLEELHQHHR